jgi:putative flippase GtrA
MSSRRNLSAGTAFRFLASGVLNTLVGFGIIAACLALGFEPNLANFTGYLLAFSLAFIVQRGWVYSGRRGHPMRFAAAAGLAYATNLATLNVLIYAGVPVILAQLGGMATYTVCFFLLTSLWVFVDPVSTGADEATAAPIPPARPGP